MTAAGSLELGDALRRVDALKRMSRMLEHRRRIFLAKDWRHYSRLIPRQQFTHIMMVRHELPCNLGRIMEMTGLTSAGASIFVNKMVKLGVFEREDDPADRRNVIIRFTPRAAEAMEHLEERLDRFVYGFFEGCTEEELRTVEEACKVAARAMERNRVL